MGSITALSEYAPTSMMWGETLAPFSDGECVKMRYCEMARVRCYAGTDGFSCGSGSALSRPLRVTYPPARQSAFGQGPGSRQQQRSRANLKDNFSSLRRHCAAAMTAPPYNRARSLIRVQTTVNASCKLQKCKRRVHQWAASFRVSSLMQSFR
jgi:hypothetical protein